MTMIDRAAPRVLEYVAVQLAVALVAAVVTARVEVAAVAGAWLLFTVPGTAALVRLVGPSHPLAHPIAAPAIATVLAAVPWALASLIAVHVHADLQQLWGMTAVFTALSAVGLARWRRPPRPDDEPALTSRFTRRSTLVLAAGFVALTAGLAVLASYKSTADFRIYAARWLAGAALGPEEPRWWLGGSLSLLGAALLGAALRGASLRDADLRGTVQRGADSIGTNSVQRPEVGAPITGAGFASRASTCLAWGIALVCTTWAARVAFTMPGAIGSAWSLDDVVYVAEALDVAAGLPIGMYEPSLGGEIGRVRSAVSVLVAPLVATLSRCTGVAPVSLHHSVLPPLLVLIGASSIGAASLLVVGRRALIAPLSIATTGLLWLGSWSYGGNAAQYLLLEAAQPKSIHLAIVLPLQLATIARVACRGARAELAIALAVAIVGHAIHPFASVATAIAGGAALVTAWLGRFAVGRRTATRPSVWVLVLGIGLGAETWIGSRRPTMALESIDRTSTDVRESRDLVRDAGDRPRPVIDPRLFFAADLQAALGVGLVGLVLGGARRRRELAPLVAMTTAAVVVSFVEPIGDVVAVALHPSIYWRARWLVPTPLLLAVAVAVLGDAVHCNLRTRPKLAAFVAVVVAPLWIAVTCAGFGGQWLRPGNPPARLSKLDAESEAVAAWLDRNDGGLILAPARLSIELPQLTAAARLLRSRPKAFVATPRRATIDARVLAALFDADSITAGELSALVTSFAIDTVIVERSQPHVRALLDERGWVRRGAIGPFEIRGRGR